MGRMERWSNGAMERSPSPSGGCGRNSPALRSVFSLVLHRVMILEIRTIRTLPSCGCGRLWVYFSSLSVGQRSAQPARNKKTIWS
jgi:hypothetical protein